MNQPAIPSKSLTCPSAPAPYRSAVATDIAATFARFGFVPPSALKGKS